MWGSLLVLAGVFALAMLTEHIAGVILPWLAAAGFLGLGIARARRLNRLNRRVLEAQELAALRRYQEALGQAWKLLPQTVSQPNLHSRLVALMAAALDQLKEYEAAIVAYDDLLSRLPHEHPGSVQLRVQKAISLLQCDHLLDADNTLRSLRGMPDMLRESAVGAAHRLALLLQQVRTNHFADAVQTAPTLLDDLRPLGVEAGFGHALMAYSFSQLPDSDSPAQAEQWWSRATLLLPAPVLADRFTELQKLAP